MGVLDNLSEEIKNAMRAKDTLRLDALRAIKSSVMLAQTAAGGGTQMTDEEEVKLVQKLIKQRKDSASIFRTQNRIDLAVPEEDQAAIISEFLPAQLSEAEVTEIIEKIINQTGAEGMKDMGKVMGMASKEMSGKADGKTISLIVKSKLS